MTAMERMKEPFPIRGFARLLILMPAQRARRAPRRQSFASDRTNHAPVLAEVCGDAFSKVLNPCHY